MLHREIASTKKSMLAQPARGRFRKIALVGHARSELYQALEKRYPKNILIPHGTTLINNRGQDYVRWHEVLFVVQHDILVPPYKNVWLEHIAKRHALANQSLGVINVPETLTEMQKSLLHEFMLNERNILNNGYYPLRYDSEGVQPDDLKIIINAVDAAILRD